MDHNQSNETDLAEITKIPHNKAPEELVAQVLDLVLQGQPVAHVAKQFGVTRRVIYKWIAREALEMRQAKDALYISRLDGLIERMLKEASVKDLTQTSLRDLIVATGIAFDKREHLHGPKPPQAQTALRLQVCWKDGSGGCASLDIETTTGPPLPPAPHPEPTTLEVEGYAMDEGESEILTPLDMEDLSDDDPRLCGGGHEYPNE